MPHPQKEQNESVTEQVETKIDVVDDTAEGRDNTDNENEDESEDPGVWDSFDERQEVREYLAWCNIILSMNLFACSILFLHL